MWGEKRKKEQDKMDAMPSTVWPSQRQTYFQELLGLLQFSFIARTGST